MEAVAAAGTQGPAATLQKWLSGSQALQIGKLGFQSLLPGKKTKNMKRKVSIYATYKPGKRSIPRN
jgi:hypothetical protein